MRWVLRLIATGEDTRGLSADLVEICRPEGLRDIADLGLTLPEAKQLLSSVQRAIVARQADSHRAAAAVLPILRQEMPPEGLAGALHRDVVRRGASAASSAAVPCLRSHRDRCVSATALPIDT